EVNLRMEVSKKVRTAMDGVSVIGHRVVPSLLNYKIL
ncbi:MAG: hypothetical protein RLZZ401_2214, partial [Pseudomonadota bacterium]